ncbi:hypothetical protein B0H14DRAFT_2777080 [Mycena olivaceomarginata]|nr:hypothetical protein B0H14DRAFT_2777080 [Mycena olivaceomarginata]
MALITSPPSPAAVESSSTSASTGPPQTPVLSDHLPLGVLPAQAVPNATTPTANAPAGGVKRTAKPNRRTTTAQRRATHNAVERQRRETLNGRFYDLAALLPNLSQIRRPSKSAIVNSSIAHITASRRQRLLAAQQLRLIKAEGDALRAEVNEWRARVGVPGVECFAVGLAGELEFEVGDLEGEMYGEEEEEHEGGGGAAYPGHGGGYEEEQFVNQQQQQLAQPHPHPHAQQFISAQPMTTSIGGPHVRQSHSLPAPSSALSSSPHSLSLHALPHPSQSHYPASIPMIASPTSASLDPAPIAHAHTHAVYDQHARQLHPHQMMLAHHQQQLHHGKWAAASQQQVQVQVQQGTW